MPKQKRGLRARQYCPGTSSEGCASCPWRVAQPMCWQRNTVHLIGQTAESLHNQLMTRRSKNPLPIWCTSELPTATEGSGQGSSSMATRVPLEFTASLETPPYPHPLLSEWFHDAVVRSVLLRRLLSGVKCERSYYLSNTQMSYLKTYFKRIIAILNFQMLSKPQS